MIWKNLKKKKVIGLIALSALSIGGISFKLSQDNTSNKDITEFTIAAESGSLPTFELSLFPPIMEEPAFLSAEL